MFESLFPIPTKVKVKLTRREGNVGGIGARCPLGRDTSLRRGDTLGESAVLGGEPLVVLVDQSAVAFWGFSRVGKAELILADEGLEPSGQLDLDGSQRRDNLFAKKGGGGRVVAEGTVGGLAQPLEGLIERAAQLPVAGKGAAQVFGIAKELAQIGVGLTAVRTAHRAAAGAGLGVLCRGGLSTIARLA